MIDRNYFDKFSERAQKVLSRAEAEAQRFNHNYIGTEHLLLGLVRDEGGIAAKVLRNLGVELYKVRSAVEFIIGRGDRIVLGEVGLTPRAKKVLELAMDEAHRLYHHSIDTEHLLLGLVREGEGIAAGVLESLGVNLEKVRTETIRVLVEASSLYVPRPKNISSSRKAGALSNTEALSLIEAMIELEAVLNEKEAAIQRQQYKLAIELRRREVALREHIDKLFPTGRMSRRASNLLEAKRTKLIWQPRWSFLLLLDRQLKRLLCPRYKRLLYRQQFHLRAAALSSATATKIKSILSGCGSICAITSARES